VLRRWGGKKVICKVRGLGFESHGAQNFLSVIDLLVPVVATETKGRELLVPIATTGTKRGLPTGIKIRFVTLYLALKLP
jgi:hypothetical protein